MLMLAMPVATVCLSKAVRKDVKAVITSAVFEAKITTEWSE